MMNDQLLDENPDFEGQERLGFYPLDFARLGISRH